MTQQQILAHILTADYTSIEDVIRIKEKQFTSMERIMALAKTEYVLKEQLKNTYKPDDLINWQLNRLLNSPHPQFAKLRGNPKYMEMLDRWARPIYTLRLLRK